MGAKILFVHTRELCYYSGSFFLKRMQEAVSRLGIESEYIALEDQQDLDRFEHRIGEHFDGVVDINWIIKVLEGLPNLLRVFREGLA